MSPLDKLCIDFRRFAGEEAFAKFVRTLNRLPINAARLRYWQESLWNSFASTEPLAPHDFATIRDRFSICEIHGLQLRSGSVDAPYSQIQYTRTQSPGGYSVDLPYSGWGVDVDDWGDGNTRKMDILYCPQCREQRAILKASGESSRTSPVTDMDNIRRLENDYRLYARSGVDASDFYRKVRDDGCTKLQGFVLLRDLMNCTLEDAMKIDSNYQDGSP